MKNKKHDVHKYKKVDLAVSKDESYLVFRCMLNCSHYIREDLIVGKESICWGCETPFVVRTKYKVKPKCDNCINRREATNVEYKKAEDALRAAGVIK